MSVMACQVKYYVKGNKWVLFCSFIVYVILLDMLLDIDECSTGVHNCTQNHLQCVNRPGTFICECSSGYELLNGICEG